MKRLSILLCALLIQGAYCWSAQRHRVTWSSSVSDYTSAIETAVSDAMMDGGIVEFDAGRTYPCNIIRVTDTFRGQTRPYMPRGIEGNGAVLEKLPGSDPDDTFFYCWNMQNDRWAHGANEDFFIRNLIVDGKYNTKYGLRVWGGKDFIIENVTVRRCGRVTNGVNAGAGLLVQGSSGNFLLENVTLRSVFSHYNLGDGISILGTINTTSAKDIKLENCYAHRNDLVGFRIASAADVFLVGCGAEQNDGHGIDIASDNRAMGRTVIMGGTQSITSSRIAVGSSTRSCGTQPYATKW